MSGMGKPEAVAKVEYEAKQRLGNYYDIAWYLRQLDDIQQEARAIGKHPAAVSAVRTMAELVGLVGTQTVAVDGRVQILTLPEGLSESAILALAMGSLDNQGTTSPIVPSFNTDITPEMATPASLISDSVISD